MYEMAKKENTQSCFQRGLISLLILALLDQEDMYGYQIVQEITERSGGAIVTEEGSLYPVLYKLQDQGMLSGEKVLVGKRMTRVYYHLEEPGRRRLQELSREYRAITQGVFQIIQGGKEKMNTAERAARRYYRKVRSWLPGGKMRRYVMTQIRETVQEFVQEHPDADVAAIQAQLGTPQEIAAAYVENMETAAVLKDLRIRRRVLFAVCATMLAILISWTVLVTIVTVRDRNSIGDAPYIEVYIE